MKTQIAALITALLLAMPVSANPPLKYDEDLDEVRDAVEQGLVGPYDQLLAKIQGRYPGRIIKVELEEEDDFWVYEIKMYDSNRNLVKLEFDAKTFRIVSAEGHDLESFFLPRVE